MLSTSLVLSIIGTASTVIAAVGYGCIQSHKVILKSGFPGCRCCCLSVGLHCGQDEDGKPELEMSVTANIPPEQMQIFSALRESTEVTVV